MTEQGTGHDTKRSAWGGVWAALRQRCPRCRKGRMFRGQFAMNDPCPECGLLFQREEGTFLGAMYVSYLLACLILIPLFFLGSVLLPCWNDIAVGLLALALYVPLTPAVFRYSRVFWVHFERYFCDSEVSAGAYEKYRLKQLAERKDGGPPR
jgi:uncharacterized protein (DUF983 family)